MQIKIQNGQVVEWTCRNIFMRLTTVLSTMLSITAATHHFMHLTQRKRLYGWLVLHIEYKLCKYSLMVKTDIGCRGQEGHHKSTSIWAATFSLEWCLLSIPKALDAHLIALLLLHDSGHDWPLSQQHCSEKTFFFFFSFLSVMLSLLSLCDVALNWLILTCRPQWQQHKLNHVNINTFTHIWHINTPFLDLKT